ncbi:MAG: hypothetical protein KTR20_15565 [Cellvibrionaceae bacterium]|nr:hypothetical protein [Cellvibrionaceae bacterium]
MTILFSMLTALLLLCVAVLAQATGMAASSYFVLMLVFAAYLLWCGRKGYTRIALKKGE